MAEASGPPMEEQQLTAAAAAGDRGAFAELVRLYQRRAYCAAYSFAGNREDARELAQDAFARAYRAMPRFHPGMPFYPWFYRVLRNICLNHLKRKRRRNETSLDELVENGFEPEDARCAGDEDLSRDELREQIRAAMSRLNPEHREILRLRHFLELSYGEIAQYLGIPEGTVMSRLHGARKSLRRVLDAADANKSRDLV